MERTAGPNREKKKFAIKYLNIAHTNVRSLVPKIDEVNQTLQKYDLDVLCVSESWLSEPVQNRVLIFPGYKIIRKDRPKTPGQHNRAAARGGGVAILHRSDLTVTTLPISTSGPCETLWVNVSGRGRRSATVGVVYRPPHGPVIPAVEDITEQLRTALTNGKPTFCLGDFNINLLCPNGPGVRRYQTALSELNLYQLIRTPTHLEPSETLIDHIITNTPDLDATVLPPTDAIADHLTVSVRVPFRRPSRRPAPFTTRSWRKANWDAVCLDLLYADWSSMYDASDVDNKVSCFLKVWWSVLDVHCPVKTITVRRPHCPWIENNPQLQTLKGERDEAFHLWRQSGLASDKNAYRKLRNKVKGCFAESKREFLCERMATDRRSFWRNIRDFALRPTKGGEEAAEELAPKQADEFNCHFASVGAHIAAELAAGSPPPLSPRPPCVTTGGMVLKSITLPELSLAISQLSKSKSVGHDGVPLHALRQCFPVIGPHILHLVNTSLLSGVVPSSWKLATVVPIHKSGPRDQPSNFRPISILPVLSKICEKVVCHQLTSYLETCRILAPSQYAYRRRHSTEDALTDVVEWMTRRIDGGHVVTVTSIDLSRAFDSVDHDILLQKLEWYGIQSKWFRSYLTDRRQRVKGGTISLPISHGVPQGSLVGPLLFSIFTNDLPAYLPHGRLVSYADDTQLLDSALPADLSLLKQRQEEAIGAVQSYFSANSLKMNPTKTTLLLAGTKQNLDRCESFNLNISGYILQPSPCVKMLGVTVDSTLSWAAHITTVTKKCNSILLSLYKIRHHLTPEVRKLLIQCHVFPHILYCLSVWGGAYECHLLRVQKIINFGARVVTGARIFDHISATVEALGWHSVHDLVNQRDIRGVTRALNDSQAPSAIKSLFTTRSAVSQRTTRATLDGMLQTPAFRLSTSRRAFSYRAATAWNKLYVK